MTIFTNVGYAVNPGYVAFLDRAVACTVCGSTWFDAVAETVAGGWSVDQHGALVRTDITIPIGRCRTCDHVCVLAIYDDAFLRRLYTADRIQGGDLPSNSGPATVRFCQPEVLETTGLIVDFGCGRGDLLRCLREVYGVPDDRLLGIDFHNHLKTDVPFRQTDLNALPAVADPPERAGFAFCCHVLEHLTDPRAFLRAVAAMVADDGHLYLEVPNFAALDPAAVHELPLVNPQHLHYFSARSLRALAESCGFETVRLDEAGHLRLLLQRRRRPAAAIVAEATIGVLARRRRKVAEEIARRAATNGPVGVWGLGMDFARMLEAYPSFRTEVESGRIALFDLLHAGGTYAGHPIRHPDEIGGFPGTVYLLPSLHLVADRMRAFVRTRADWPKATVVDPWRDGCL